MGVICFLERPKSRIESYFFGKFTLNFLWMEDKIERIRRFLEKCVGKPYEAGKVVEQYFSLYYSKDGVLVGLKEKEEVIERELRSCGYFVIVTSKKMTAKEAIELYKSRDASEKLFRGDKSYLGNKSFRTYSSESISGKIFVEFIALIIRSRIYNCIKAEADRMDSRPNYMNVPAAIKELEKIEMVLFFVMSLEEAVELVVYAFQNAESGDIMVQKAPACTIGVYVEGNLGVDVPNYVDEIVSTKVVKIIQSYTGIVNKMVWRK